MTVKSSSLLNTEEAFLNDTKLKIIQLFHKREKRYNIDQIVAGCKRGESFFQELLFKRLAASILTTCRRYETVQFGAKDILQETFITTFDKINQYDPLKASIETWMKKIAINIGLKQIRNNKIKTLDLQSLSLENSLHDQEVEVLDQVSEEQLLNIIAQLPIGYRTIFNLYVIDNFSHKEIAKQLNISTATSRTQLFKAKKLIQQKLKLEKKVDAKTRLR